ncbi:exo-beta-N-acetylmuramidase NamZ family protein [Aureivirga marina]|uniref:exo-beta-N-acetylmuramidase NamZ family protein n=1 Tax=Aureivirga marina TaxID=1182451 RepID=UPI0018C8F395|nr:DUF1343 domain-containing protein [Aureivirga marina]
MLKFKFKNTYFLLVISLFFLLISCNAQNSKKNEPELISAANNLEQYLPLLKGKKIGIVANQTSVIKNTKGNYTHLVDSLLSLHVNVKKVFAPEHGFRGKADAGEKVSNSIDQKTNLPIISLYGKNKKPSNADLSDIDILLFDIQDVGVRFYTYISTLHYIMEAASDNHKQVIVLDRPNPNGHYIDGPVLREGFSSFVGMHPVPVVYGMTIGEYAKMINGEDWTESDYKCDLTIIPLTNYNRDSIYELPIKPSPNLPNKKSINLYPSLCFFEGTNVSCGRGTDQQFQIYGSPFLPVTRYSFSFEPKPNAGAKYPKHNGEVCFGEDLTSTEYLSEIKLDWLLNAYYSTMNKNEFFLKNKFFNKLAGNDILMKQVIDQDPIRDIKASWIVKTRKFKKTRQKYLLYPDFKSTELE